MDKKGESFTQLYKLIEYIQGLYKYISDSWSKTDNKKINLKKNTVSDIDINGDIFDAIDNYIEFLNKNVIDISIDLEDICIYKVTMRIKSKNSVVNKINTTKTDGKVGYGKKPINKCLNDLVGFRIFFPELVAYGDIKDYIEKTYGRNKYKCIDSSKGEYKATHIYFQKDNRTFPWELQIWNECDAVNNFRSHKIYKQQYTSWEQENEKGDE